MDKHLTTKFSRTLIASAMLLALSSCGGGDSSSITSGRGGDSPGVISVGITDAAVDNAQEVWVQFTGVTIQPADGDAIDFTFDSAKNINLLSLQGTHYADLIADEMIPVGSYDWMRLHVNASEDGVLDSYIKLNDGSDYELSIPSGSQTGLKINTGFELASEDLNLMIDFDLRKSVVLSAGEYKLRPTLRMVDLGETGTITGTIDSQLINAENCSDTDPTTGNAVYLFEGADVVADDMDNQNPEAITSALVELNATTGDYEYVIGFVPVGEYTLAFTCQADLDDPDSRDDIDFSLTENVTVVVDITEPEPVR